jgi:hypothetical protein
MKNTILATSALILILVLAACGTSSETSATSTSLSLEGQLLVGTLKLEDTDLAVTSAKAAELLPLWEALASLSDSSIASSLEVNAVVTQIQSTMGADQIAAITAMRLTQTDLAAAAAQTNLAANAARMTATIASGLTQTQGNGGMGNPGVDPNAGIAPLDVGTGGTTSALGGASTSASQTTATKSVSASSGGTSGQVSTAQIDLVVELLKTKIG